MRPKETPSSLDRYVEAKQRLDGAQGKQKTRCGSMRIIHRSNSSFFSFLFRFYEPINRNEFSSSSIKDVFILSRDRYRCSRTHCRKSSPRNFRVENWRASERWKWSVEKTGVRQPGYRRSVHCAIGEAAKSYRGRKATRNFVIHVSFILKKFLFLFSPLPFFSLQTKAGVVPSFPLFLNSNQRSKSFRKEKKTCSLFTSIESFPLRIPSPLSCVTSIAKK